MASIRELTEQVRPTLLGLLGADGDRQEPQVALLIDAVRNERRDILDLPAYCASMGPRSGAIDGDLRITHPPVVIRCTSA